MKARLNMLNVGELGNLTSNSTRTAFENVLDKSQAVVSNILLRCLAWASKPRLLCDPTFPKILKRARSLWRPDAVD